MHFSDVARVRTITVWRPLCQWLWNTSLHGNSVYTCMWASLTAPSRSPFLSHHCCPCPAFACVTKSGSLKVQSILSNILICQVMPVIHYSSPTHSLQNPSTQCLSAYSSCVNVKQNFAQWKITIPVIYNRINVLQALTCYTPLC